MKRSLSAHAFVVVVLTGAVLAGLCGCKVHKQGEGTNEKVDIETPVGSLHVNTQVDPKETGLEVYPGATRAEDEEKKHAANVSLDLAVAGFKMVALKYRSDDPPDKLLDFYRKQLKAYGDVSECHGSITFSGLRLRCDETGLRNETNLVAGTEDRHRIVSVKPEGKGSAFALIYVQTRGERGTM
ncbi:MAG: hypothetical protein WB347_16575 [Terriglobales bacterium]